MNPITSTAIANGNVRLSMLDRSFIPMVFIVIVTNYDILMLFFQSDSEVTAIRNIAPTLEFLSNGK